MELIEGQYNEATLLVNKQIISILVFGQRRGRGFDRRHFQSPGWNSKILVVSILGFGYERRMWAWKFTYNFIQLLTS